MHIKYLVECYCPNVAYQQEKKVMHLSYDRAVSYFSYFQLLHEQCFGR